MEENEEGPRKACTVFVVDDDVLVGRALRRVLLMTLKDRVNVTVFDSPVEALQALDASVDILITDYQMPRLSGPELIARGRQRHPALQVVLMSGDTGAAERLAAAAVDPSIRTMDKPFSKEALLALMAELMA